MLVKLVWLALHSFPTSLVIWYSLIMALNEFSDMEFSLLESMVMAVFLAFVFKSNSQKKDADEIDGTLQSMRLSISANATGEIQDLRLLHFNPDEVKQINLKKDVLLLHKEELR